MACPFINFRVLQLMSNSAKSRCHRASLPDNTGFSNKCFIGSIREISRVVWYSIWRNLLLAHTKAHEFSREPNIENGLDSKVEDHMSNEMPPEGHDLGCDG